MDGGEVLEELWGKLFVKLEDVSPGAFCRASEETCCIGKKKELALLTLLFKVVIQICIHIWYLRSAACQTFTQSFSSHFHFCSPLPCRPTTSMSTGCCTVEYATVNFWASMNRWGSNQCAVSVLRSPCLCVLLWMLYKCHHILSVRPFTRLCVQRSIRQPPIALNHDPCGLKSCVLFFPPGKTFACKMAELWRRLERVGDMEGMFLAFVSFLPAGKRNLIWKSNVVGKCWIAWSSVFFGLLALVRLRAEPELFCFSSYY